MASIASRITKSNLTVHSSEIYARVGSLHSAHAITYNTVTRNPYGVTASVLVPMKHAQAGMPYGLNRTPLIAIQPTAMHQGHTATGTLRRVFAFATLSSPSDQPPSKKLVLYSKQGCCLCDGLKEKLTTVLSAAGPGDDLHGIQVEVRKRKLRTVER